MAETSLYTHASGTETADGDSDWLDASAVTNIEVDVALSAVTAGALVRSNSGEPDVANTTLGIGTPAAGGPGNTVGIGSIGGDPVAGGEPAVEFFLDGQSEDGEVWTLWQSGVLYEPFQCHGGFGPSLGDNRPFPAQVRLRWVLGGGHATFAAEVSGR